jgi:hypothetical protein
MPSLKMRDLLFKNLTSQDKKRRIIASSEIVDKEGVRSIVRRHFVCIAREINDKELEKPEPYLYVLKQRNTKEHKERFFCRMKGSLFAVSDGKLFLIIFMHSLKINLEAITKQAVKYNEEE